MWPYLGRTRLMFDVARLAPQADSTRLVTVFISQDANPSVNIPGVSPGHHSLTHRGNKPENLDELRRIEEAQVRELARLLSGLRAVAERSGTLLNHTAVLYGANMGNAHSNTNLPVLLAGGGFRHGQHLAFDARKNRPLANLFVTGPSPAGFTSTTCTPPSCTCSGWTTRS